MAEEQQLASQPESSKGFWETLSLIQKIVLFVLIISFVFIAWTFLFGGVNSIWELAFILILVIVLFIIGWVVIVAAQLVFKPQYYSPKEDYFTKLVNMAHDYCPDNLNDLYFQGSDWKKHVRAGKIIGCIGIPYFLGKPKVDDEGRVKWYFSKLLKKKIQIFEKVTYGKDGDTFFIIEKGGFFGLFKKKHYIRCNHSLHSDLNGDVIIFDINPQPFGKFFEYPYKQLQKDPERIMLQSQLEVIIATHEHQGDLISQAADAGTYYNPFFRLMEKQKAEIQRE